MSQDTSLNIETLLNLAPEQTLAREISNFYMTWKSAKRIATDQWKETISYVYATSTRETTNGPIGGLEGEGGWSNSTHIPKITQIYDNLIANYRFALFPNSDWFEFEGSDYDEVSADIREKAENYLKTKHALNKFEDVTLQLLDDWVLYGNCFAQVTYETKSTVDTEGEDVNITVDYSGPVVNRISPHDIVFNPTATSFEHSPKIIREVLSIGEFLRQMEEDQTKEFDQDAVKQMREFRRAAQGDTDGEIDKSLQMTLDGFGTYSIYLKSGQVELLTFYGDIYDVFADKLHKNRVITVADRRFVIRNEEINTLKGKAHIYHSGWRSRPDNLWSMGPLDNLVGMQYRLNHLENARADALDQMITPTRIIVGDVDEEGVTPGIPGGIYRITGGEGSVTNLAPDTTILQADLLNNTTMNLMEELVGAPKEALGFRTPGEKTLGEVNQLANAASRNFQNRIERFESTFLEQVLNAELELGKQFMDQSETVKGTSPDIGVTLFTEIKPEDLKVNGKIVARGARHFARQNQLLQNIIQLQQIISSDPLVVQHYPSKKLARLYEDLLGVEEFGLFEAFGRVAEEKELAGLQQESANNLQDMQDQKNIDAAAEQNVANGSPLSGN